MHVPFKGELEFGAHAVGAAHEHRLLVFAGHFKERAKAANAGQHAFAQSFAGQGLDALDQGVACVNVNAGVFVGKRGVHAIGRLEAMTPWTVAWLTPYCAANSS